MNNVKDYTWNRLILTNDLHTTFFRYAGHGGITNEPIYADLVKGQYDAVKMLKTAQKQSPSVDWVIKRFNYTIDDIPFDILKDCYETEVRRRALSKLTEEEQQILGLK